MVRALPVLIILGFAIYTFFDVLNTREDKLQKLSKPMWLLVALIPIVGAAVWFMVGRPPRDRSDYAGPRVINIRPKPKPVAPDDDPNFLRKVDEDLWIEKRRRQQSKENAHEDSATDESQSQSDSEQQTPDEKQSGGSS